MVNWVLECELFLNLYSNIFGGDRNGGIDLI